MRIKVWGARGSIPAPGPETMRYGGNTSCVELTLSDGSTLILDAGTGIRNLGLCLGAGPIEQPIHILLTHLHLDHIQGLVFFAPAFRPQTVVPCRRGRCNASRVRRTTGCSVNLE